MSDRLTPTTYLTAGGVLSVLAWFWEAFEVADITPGNPFLAVVVLAAVFTVVGTRGTWHHRLDTRPPQHVREGGKRLRTAWRVLFIGVIATANGIAFRVGGALADEVRADFFAGIGSSLIGHVYLMVGVPTLLYGAFVVANAEWNTRRRNAILRAAALRENGLRP
jgi:hypothetical protein